jgi:hypothetical protein
VNPYVLGGVLLWVASLVGVGTWMYGAGGDAQQVEDQREFNRINTERAQQTDQANVKYRAKQDEVIAAQAERDGFKNQLEKERGEHRIETDALRARYAGLGLRFRPSQGATTGDRGGRTGSTEGNTAGADAPADLQLPDAVTGDLRQLAFEADRLKNEYAACYRYVNGPVK